MPLRGWCLIIVELQQRVAVPMTLFLKQNCLGRSRGINIIDSTDIKVCHNRRIHNHKVLAAVAEKGQCSLGWFYWFKLHLSINDKGGILTFTLQRQRGRPEYQTNDLDDGTNIWQIIRG